MVRLTDKPNGLLQKTANDIADSLEAGGRLFMNPVKAIAIAASDNPLINLKTLAEIYQEALFTNTYDGVVLIDMTEIADCCEELSMEQVLQAIESLKNHAEIYIVYDHDLCRNPSIFEEFIKQKIPEISCVEGGVSL